MLNRRSVLQGLVGAFGFLVKKPMNMLMFGSAGVKPYFVPIDKAKEQWVVSTLEFPGWGKPRNSDGSVEYGPNDGTPFYHPYATYETREEAEGFVKSLIPRLTEVHTRNLPELHISQIRSGYRDAVRAQFREEVIRLELEIVSKKKDGTMEPVFWDFHPPFWTISAAWAYISNIRVNGNPVAISQRPGGISSYIVEPFIKGNPKIIEHELRKKLWGC